MDLLKGISLYTKRFPTDTKRTTKADKVAANKSATAVTSDR
jgi:hypothetical protein